MDCCLLVLFVLGELVDVLGQLVQMGLLLLELQLQLLQLLLLALADGVVLVGALTALEGVPCRVSIAVEVSS